MLYLEAISQLLSSFSIFLIFSVVWRLGYFFGHVYVVNCSCCEKPPLWWTYSITKTREDPTQVTEEFFPIVTQDLGILWWDLHKYKSYNNKDLIV
jgi:hypothetical protein